MHPPITEHHISDNRIFNIRKPKTAAPGRRLGAAHWLRFCLLALGLFTAAGCSPQSTKPAARARPQSGDVRLAVIDDHGMAEAIGHLKAEWNAVTGGKLEVIEAPADALADLSKLQADAVIYPSERLGELAEAGRIIPIPKSTVDSADMAWSDIFPVVREGDASWGNQVYAVPFGTPVFTLAYRRDLFEKFDRKPPQTWEQYRQEVKFFADPAKRNSLLRQVEGQESSDPGPWQPTLEPLAAGWASRTLLARAAAYAKHRDNFSTLFNIDDLAPLVAGPPFVRALDDLVAAAHAGRPNTPDGHAEVPPALDPAGVFDALAAGRAAMALVVPTARARESSTSQPKMWSGALSFAELPGSEQTYNFASHTWETRRSDEPLQVTLVPIAGRLGSLVKGTAHPDAAVRLLTWLSGPKWGAEVSLGSPATTTYRQSQIDGQQKLLTLGVDKTAAKQYSAAVAQALSRSVWVPALRIPGADEYYAALDAAVEQALAGKQTSAEALQAAAKTWAEISDRHGLVNQLRAYRHSLGLE